MSNVNIGRLREILTQPRINATYTPAPGEFDGDTSPRALAAWDRYLDTPLNPGFVDVPQAREQDAFTTGYDAGKNFGLGYAAAIHDLNNSSESSKS